MTTSPFSPLRVSVYYDPADSDFCKVLNRFLAPLKQSERIEIWDEGNIRAGQNWQEAYEQHLASDAVLILLLSPDFLASEICQHHLQQAYRRYRNEGTVVVAILVRPCLWRETAFQQLQILPRTHKALSTQIHPEAAWQKIAAEISYIVDALHQRVLLISAPEDQGVVERLQRDLDRTSVTFWHLRFDDQTTTGDQQARVRKAMRQATHIVLIASPAAYSSRAVHMMMELAADYGRPVLAFWAQGEDADQAGADRWSITTIVDARNGRYEHACRQLGQRLKPQEASEHWAPSAQAHSLSLAPTAPMPEPLDEPRNPYKGLSPFTRDDTGDFFGRQRFVSGLLDRLQQMLALQQAGKRQTRLLAIVGASGSGKSSVVQAGLLPQLQGNALAGSQEWIYLDRIVPGVHPIESLALSLSQQPALSDAATLSTALRSDSLRSLHLLASQLVGTSMRKVVLFIDQFEEVFTLTTSEEERRQFFDLLAIAGSEPHGPLLIILTLRSDFYDQLMRYPAFFHLLYDQHVPVLAMGREDLRQVIEGPAKLPDVQLSFEQDLVGDLLFDMREEVGALPLLEFTLDQLFAHRDGHRFTQQAYHDIGGLHGALTRHIEATYAGLPSDTHRALTRTLFLRLIEPGVTEQDITRRRATFAEFMLTDPVQTTMLRGTIDAFVNARLLTASEQAGNTTLEVSHEVLIHKWPRLRNWVDEARKDIRLQQTISHDAAEWQQHRNSKDHLYQGSRLKEAQRWAQRNTASQQEVTFLRASVRQRTQRVGSIILALLLILSTTGVAYWFYRHQEPAPTLVTTLHDSGVGSLRWATDAAPLNSIITFDPSLWGQMMVLNADLPITRQLTIQGPPMRKLTISSKTHQILVGSGVTVKIFNIAFTGGKANQSSLLNNKGTLTLTNSTVSGNSVSAPEATGGGIENDGTLNLTNSTVSGNSASSSSKEAYGGGIMNGGTLMLTNSTVSGNSASSSYRVAYGGGIENESESTLTLTNSTVSHNSAFSSSNGATGGGIDNNGTLNLTNSTVSGNFASSPSSNVNGGGIESNGTLNLMNSTVSGNSASSSNKQDSGVVYGGGIEDSGTLNLTNSTVSGDSASSSSNQASGGGIMNDGMLTLTNSTVSGDSASASDDASGGGIFNDEFATLTLTNCTISDNSSTNSTVSDNSSEASGGGIFNMGEKVTIAFSTIYGNRAQKGGGIFSKDDTLQVKTSLIAGNYAITNPDSEGTLISGGYNLLQNTPSTTFLDPNHLHHTDITVLSLADLHIDTNLHHNGGPTLTLALFPGSPAIDAIPIDVCRSTGITTDQRGVGRPQGTGCDIGAFEYVS